MAIGRPNEKVDEWEAELEMDELSEVLEAQLKAMKLDREICELTQTLEALQNKICTAYSKVWSCMNLA